MQVSLAATLTVFMWSGKAKHIGTRAFLGEGGKREGGREGEGVTEDPQQGQHVLPLLEAIRGSKPNS